MVYSELTEKIIKCAYIVYNKLGFGFLESVYERCMLIELYKAGLKAESQKPITVYYDDKIVGEKVKELKRINKANMIKKDCKKIV